MSLFDDAKLIITPNGYKASKLYSLKPFDGSGDCTVVRATTATRVNSAGLIESVAANVPRLDYSGGVTCPAILVEPQDTNINTYSEDFSTSYLLNNGTVTTNSTVSPDGTVSADTLVQNIGAVMIVQKTITVPNDSLVKYFSIFVKKESTDKFFILAMRFGGGGTLVGTAIQVNKRTGAYFENLNLGGGYTMPTDIGVDDWGDYWKVYIAQNNNSTGNTSLSLTIQPNRGVALNDFTQNDGNAILWGAEVKNTLSLYIPTVATAVTRNADVITATPPVGTTEITEYFEDGTTNVITTIPVTYTMSEGRISKVVMI